MSTYNLSERTDRASLRRAGHGGHGIADIDRPQRRTAIPLADLAAAFDEFNARTTRAIEANRGPSKPIDYEAANAKTRARAEWAARKKEREQ